MYNLIKRKFFFFEIVYIHTNMLKDLKQAFCTEKRNIRLLWEFVGAWGIYSIQDLNFAELHAESVSEEF